ncbi:hypothetical protein F5Y16DRAFT_164137 [Xylariaceae sp. FL0255]|nr:hypothetical protein F5Y16DRAFT_164137 [Xylariaceae sp. FL0255]
MAKWKELGEVPDSDDESTWDSDSDESLPSLPLPVPSRAAPLNAVGKTILEDASIWDIPRSSQSLHAVSQEQNHLPDAEAQPSPPLSEPQISGSQREPTPAHSPTFDELNDIYSIDKSGDENVLFHPDTEEANPPHASQPSSASLGALYQPDSNILRDDRFRPADAASNPQNVPRGQQEETIGEEFARLGRSFRPRKPIQQHPYLLESVQYNKTLKSHGVRPIRVQVEEEKSRRPDEDSQEQDYEEESQATGRNTTHGDTEESQRAAALDHLSDVELMTLSDDGEPSPSPQLNRGSPSTRLNSSQDVDDEFPDPADTEKWKKILMPTKQTRKRQTSPKVSSKHKLPKVGRSVRSVNDRLDLPSIEDIFNIPVSPPQTSPVPLATTPLAAVNRLRRASLGLTTPKPSSNTSSRMQSPAPANQARELIDLTTLNNEDSEADGLTEDTSSGSEADPEQVRRVAKRMRGVLPASWLRLDQHASNQKAKPTARPRSPSLSPRQSPRKGIARRRVISPRPDQEAVLFLHDESDADSDTVLELPNPEPTSQNNYFPIFEDDAASVVEEDHIDQMLPGSKRSGSHGSVPRKKRKKSQLPIFQGQVKEKKRQQRITGLLSRTKSSTTPKSTYGKTAKSSTSMSKRQKTATEKSPIIPKPPRLSILDVIEPNAPDFLRIAARTVGRRRDKGRSSPSNKTIMLGTRQDTIDAASVLRSWKRGSIQQRSPDSMPDDRWHRQNRKANMLSSETDLSSTGALNSRHNITTSTRFSQPRRMVKQAKIDNFIAAGGGNHREPRLESGDSIMPRSKTRTTSYRPAQLEVDGNEPHRQTFIKRKKALDALYRQSRNPLPVPQNVHLEQLVDQQTDQDSTPSPESVSPSHRKNDNRRPERSLRRKPARPHNVDVSAPQFSHANDPLPQITSPLQAAIDASKEIHNGKLLGLAPFGSHYTQHFEVFPLDHGVFFHQSTIIGNGRLARAFDVDPLGDLSRIRERCTFHFDEKTLCWGVWDAQVSSELGIILDWMMDKLDAPTFGSQLEASSAVQAADFILIYIQDHFSLREREYGSLFASRIVDVLQNLDRRIKEVHDNSKRQARPFIEALNRVLVFAAQALRLCQKLDRGSEAFRIEEILKRLGSDIARTLIRKGFAEIRDVYDSLQQLSFREQGIRDEQYLVICWVTLIRTFEELKIPRAGFWDVASPVIFDPSTESTYDASVLEKVWYDMFTLLPLGEFDKTGVMTPAMRHSNPLEGWVLPQRLLRRVFELYQTSSRQLPSFNEYLRALVSRCHYLVEQWGWRKSNTILGQIFDFFAAHDLHNLRNEEVYQSPNFLEELSRSPVLTVSLEDRCFHIFLKMIALSIKRLQKYGQIKEIRNLVARLLPNHNRQYDKAMATHEADIAALRNHHDLLCTLFWVAPPEMRPAVQSIEGLVMLGSSHKEACLINVRACRRLSCFIVAKSEDISAYKPFANWQKNIFNQVLEQYLLVETEVDQQLLAMSPEASKNITPEQKNDVIRRNKKVALDTMHFSLKAFLEVLQHTTNLNSASFVLNQYPLEQVPTHLKFSSTDADWGILQVLVDIIGLYLIRIDDSTVQEATNQTWHTEDAIMLLERKMGVPLISMVRGLVHKPSPSLTAASERSREASVEQAFILIGRLARRFANAQLLRIPQFLQRGKHAIFQDYGKPTLSPSRKYVSLFLASVLEEGSTGLTDLQLEPLEMFLAEVVKPNEYLAFENRFAMALKRCGEAMLENATIDLGKPPDYNSNRDLFNHAIIWMRKFIHRAAPDQKQGLKNQYFKALRLAMDRMKTDSKLMTLNSTGHLNYVEFVRTIISLIRSQDLCPVDPFFYQISPEYSPSKQDPRLQTAGILSWGLRLDEGDAKATSGLFYLLFPNFKIALANGALKNEIDILKDSMRHGHIFAFMLGMMIPAIVRTTSQAGESWVLLETYVEAMNARLSAPCIRRQIWGDGLVDLLTLYHTVLGSIRCLREQNIFEIRPESLISLTLMMRILNLFSSSTTACLIDEPESRITEELSTAMSAVTDFTREAGEYLSDLVASPSRGNISTLDADILFSGLRSSVRTSPPQHEEQITRFSNHMAQDIRDNWVMNDSVMTVRGPSRPKQAGPVSTQSGRGSTLTTLEPTKIVKDLEEQIQEWNYANDMMRPRRLLDDALLDEILF